MTRRSNARPRFGPASDIYFGIIHSSWFVELLSRISGIDDLLPDPHLAGGGLHETRRGGHFAVHRDFDRHIRYGFDNEMVFITYLNEDWNPAWGGALELWSQRRNACEKSVPPEFGTSVLLLHGPESFHGHPSPLAVPEGRTRRSVAAYYYQNRDAVPLRYGRISSVFMFARRSRRLRRAVLRLAPPIAVDALKRLLAR